MLLQYWYKQQAVILRYISATKKAKSTEQIRMQFMGLITRRACDVRMCENFWVEDFCRSRQKPSVFQQMFKHSQAISRACILIDITVTNVHF